MRENEDENAEVRRGGNGVRIERDKRERERGGGGGDWVREVGREKKTRREGERLVNTQESQSVTFLYIDYIPGTHEPGLLSSYASRP